MKVVRTIGIVGGGQLGRMLTLAAKPLGFEIVVLEASVNCPAAQVGAQVIEGGLYDAAALQKLAAAADVITVEIEHLNTDALAEIAAKGTPVHPAPTTIKMIQDKYQQKVLLSENGIPVADFQQITDSKAAHRVLEEFGGSMMLKSRHGAYDGRGNALLTSPAELEAALQEFAQRDLYAERLVGFAKELSVLIARDPSGGTKVYDVVETRHERSICVEAVVPADISYYATSNATKLAAKVSSVLQGAGVFAIEMFLLKDGSVLVNEIAPRVHNSGHHTIEATATSQFEQHIRAITGLPLGDVRLLQPAAVMVNILGETNAEMSFDPSPALTDAQVHVHWYGKNPVKIDRKMGHITALGGTVEEAKQKANKARKALSI